MSYPTLKRTFRSYSHNPSEQPPPHVQATGLAPSVDYLPHRSTSTSSAGCPTKAQVRQRVLSGACTAAPAFTWRPALAQEVMMLQPWSVLPKHPLWGA